MVNVYSVRFGFELLLFFLIYDLIFILTPHVGNFIVNSYSLLQRPSITTRT